MIDNGDWYVSYDNGGSWHYMGRATGEQGYPGDSIFTWVDYTSSSDYVIFTLSTGMQIQLPTWSAFEWLRECCNQANMNIESLWSIVNAIQSYDYLVSISPVYDGYGEVGYTLQFSQSGYITIWHGAAGRTPQIGVRQGDDGRYYWTVDGEWLYDDWGQPVPTTGQNGEPGAPGQDGAPGQNGITPQLKVENDYWYVSYDNGTTWKKLSKATGAAGEDGDSFFKSVTETEKYVSMVLADGTEIRIPKYAPEAVDLTLSKVSGYSAFFAGKVNRSSLDLKVTVYYATYPELTVYRNLGSVSVTEFPNADFTLKVNGLAEKTQYFYFTEVICNGTKTFSEVGSFVTGEADSYVDWEEGDNVEGEI